MQAPGDQSAAEAGSAGHNITIANRLFLSATILSFTILLIAGVMLSQFYQRAAEDNFDERLSVYLRALVADLASAAESVETNPEEVSDPQFALALSGWYWQITRLDTEKPVIKSSRSLFAARLPRLADLGVPGGLGGARQGYAIGPDGRRLRIIERVIDTGDNGVYLVQVAATTAEIEAAIQRFDAYLVVTFALLAIALIASSALQLRYGLAPLRQLQEGVAAIRRGEAESIAGTLSPDLAPLAGELNLLIGANRAVVERARTQVGNLAHALKTPLSVIINEAALQRGAFAGKVQEQAAIMRDQVSYYLDRAVAAVRAGAAASATDVEPVVRSPHRRLRENLRRARHKLHAGYAATIALPRRTAGSRGDDRQSRRQRRQVGGERGQDRNCAGARPGRRRTRLLSHRRRGRRAGPCAGAARGCAKRGRRLDETCRDRPGLDRRRSRRAVWRQFDAGREPNGRASRGFEAACDAERADSCASLSGKVFPSGTAVTIKAPMQWLVFAVFSGVAVLSVLWPLLRTPKSPSRDAIDVAFYKDQLAAIDRDAAGGLVPAADAEGAKAEAARRLLAAAEAAPQPVASEGRAARYAAIAAFVFVPAVALGLYSQLGHPAFPDLPLSARLKAAPGRMDLMAAIAKIEAHLAQDPQDGRGYEVLAPVYLRLGRFDDAVNASAAALRLLGDAPERQARYGEALVAAAGGAVTPQARQAFEAASAKEPSLPLPRFFLGLAAAQGGDKERARDIWETLLKVAPADAPWTATLRQQLAALPGAAATAVAEADGTPSGPAANPALAAKIQSMSGAEQSSAIQGMVDNLAARLAQNGQDVEGWLRLVRAYFVLHEAEKAKSALIDAKRNLAGDATATARIEALARELGLEG